MSVPFHVTTELGGSGIAAFRGEVELRVSLHAALAPDSTVRSRPGLPSWLSASAGMGVPVMSSSTAKAMSEFAGDLLHGVERADLALRQSDGPFAVDADRVDLRGGGTDENDGIEFVGFERQDAAFVLEQDGCFFAGLLDDLGVLFDGLLSDFVLRLTVEVAEVDDLVEHAAGGAGDGGFGDGAVLESLGHLLGV